MEIMYRKFIDGNKIFWQRMSDTAFIPNDPRNSAFQQMQEDIATYGDSIVEVAA